MFAIMHECVELGHLNEQSRNVSLHPDEYCHDNHLLTPLVRRMTSDLSFQTHVSLDEEHIIQKRIGT